MFSVKFELDTLKRHHHRRCRVEDVLLSNFATLAVAYVEVCAYMYAQPEARGRKKGAAVVIERNAR